MRLCITRTSTVSRFVKVHRPFSRDRLSDDVQRHLRIRLVALLERAATGKRYAQRYTLRTARMNPSACSVERGLEGE
jgi:hypothetical protein